ncbi:MAG TPA: hypothetical protein PKA06_07995, partial [Gemmatales bacterium]|nr:hypothetical protein [Gemmatales bacterium]
MTKLPAPRRSPSWAHSIAYFALFGIGLLLAWHFWPRELIPPRFTISPETTYFTKPVREDGYIDYRAALNEKYSEGITPENNALVPLMQAMGSEIPAFDKIPEEFFDRLGMERPSRQSNHLVKIETLASEENWKELESPTQFEEWYKKVLERPWKREDYPQLANWLERNRSPLALVEQAAKRSRFYAPVVYSSEARAENEYLLGAILPHLQTTRELHQMLIARAMLSIGEKSYEAAWNDLLMALQLSHLYSQGSLLIESILGMSERQRTCEATISLLECPLPAALVQKIEQDLQSLPPFQNVSRQINLGERAAILDTLQRFHMWGTSGEDMTGLPRPPIPGYFKHREINRLRAANWDPVLKKVNQWYDRLAETATKSKRSERDVIQLQDKIKLNFMRIEVQNARQSWWAFLRSAQGEVELFGNQIIVLVTPAIDNLCLAQDRAEQKFRLLALAVQLARHRQEKGEYPENLHELSPKPSTALLIDISNEKPLYYEHTTNG